jgi:hypothetical protein
METLFNFGLRQEQQRRCQTPRRLFLPKNIGDFRGVKQSMGVCQLLFSISRSGSWSSNRLFLATLRQGLPFVWDFNMATNICRTLDNRLTLFIAGR